MCEVQGRQQRQYHSSCNMWYTAVGWHAAALARLCAGALGVASSRMLYTCTWPFSGRKLLLG
jgi:hypothetical protein